MDEIPLSLLFAIVAILILLSAFFSSSETGMMALNRYRLKHMSKKGNKGAIRASRLLKNPDRLISLILIGNNLVNFLAAALVTLIATKLWGEAIGVAVAPVILTVVFLIFAEITPKTIAAFYPEKIAFPATSVLVPLMKLLYPFVWMVNKICRTLLKLVNIDPNADDNEKLSSDELRTIVDEAGHMIPKRNQGMLMNILDLEDATVEDIMIPRNEIIGVNLDDSDEDILNQLRDTEITRIPIYKEDSNNVLGILHLRKLSRIIDENGNLNRKILMKEARSPYFVPESTPLNTQLLNFQKQKRRMALVVDEYGVIQGLVTLEDILEEIVGEFTSNIEADEDDIIENQEGNYTILGTATIRDINRALSWELPTEGPKTLNGLLLEHLEGFPEAAVSIRIEHYYFELEAVKDNIIEKAKAFHVPQPQESEEAAED